ncbi:MAG: hypothetical protein PHF84_01015, partial [bacterium]|nr:hypothetical protein [bacterium]
MAETDQSLYLLFSHNGNGNLSSCNCPTHPNGGMTRRASYIREFRRTHGNVLLVSTGDETGIIEEPIQDKYVLQALQLMRYDLIVPGDQELVYDPAFLRKQGKELDFLACNLFITNKKEALFRPYCFMERAGMKLLFIGLIGRDTVPSLRSSSIRWTEYDGELKALLKKFRARSDMVILLSHSGLNEDKRIAGQFSNIDVIIGSHSQDLLKEPVRSGKTWIVQAGDKGQYMGVLRMAKKKNGIERSFRTITLDPGIKDDQEIKTL